VKLNFGSFRRGPSATGELPLEIGDHSGRRGGGELGPSAPLAGGRDRRNPAPAQRQ